MSPTRDLQFLDSVLRHPDVYGPSRDDASPPRDTITVARHLAAGQTIFLRITWERRDSSRHDGAPRRPCSLPATRYSLLPSDLGFISFTPLARGHIGHTCLLPNCRGALAIRAGKLAVAWMFTHTGTQSLVSHCWENRPHVLLFARRVGFVEHTQTLWPARVDGARIFSTGVLLTRERWRKLNGASAPQSKIENPKSKISP